MLDIGRANISLDYDSVWYGLRSAFTLDNQSSIYQNLGLIGLVYTFSKGLEVYLLPISSTGSYGFIYAANILFGLFILFVTYKILVVFSEKYKALIGSTLVSAVPGIMNMTITAKSDVITLLIQLICIYFALIYLKNHKQIYFNLVLATALYSLTLKPTLIAFTSSVLIAFLVICCIYKTKIKFDKESLFIIIVSIIDTTLVWLRTYLIVGVPATSILYGFFTKLGFKANYPYMPNQSSPFRSNGFF